MTFIINLLHIFVFAPGLLFIVNYPQYNTLWVRLLLAGLSLMLFYYHGSKALRTQHWVSWFHTIIIAPLLLILSYQGNNIHTQVTQITNLLGFGAILYHSYRAYGKMS